MKKLQLRRNTVIIGLPILLLVLLFRMMGGFEFLELKAIDAAFHLRGAVKPAAPVVIVAIDDESFNETGMHWPWPRSYFARIVDQLAHSGARVIVLDVTFYEPFEGDAALAAAIQRAGNVILANHIAVIADPKFRLEQVQMPIAALVKTGAPIGLSNFPADRDGFGRNILAYQSHNDQTYYHWSVIAAANFLRQPLPANPTPTEMQFGARAIPLRDQALLVNFRGPARTFRNVPAYQVVNGDASPEFFKDKVVLIGATTETLHDTYATPFGGNSQPMPGVELGANAIETLIAGTALKNLEPLPALFLMLIAGISGLLLNAINRPSRALGGLALLILAYALLFFVAFSVSAIEIPVVGVLAALFFTFIVPTVETAVAEEAAKRRVRAIFSQFIAPEMVAQLVEQGVAASRGKRAELTILFSDIRGFTTLSEKLAPDAVVKLLNDYLEAMTEIIFKHGGTVDKFEGDAIIAFWGAPQSNARHAPAALAAALAMRQELARLKAKWNSGITEKFEIGIGLNTGEVFVGLIGSQRRVNYTVIGDHVNLAARIQDLTKDYQWPLLISAPTYEQVKEEFDAEFLEAKLVKGKTVPVGIYKVLGPRGAATKDLVRPLFA